MIAFDGYLLYLPTLTIFICGILILRIYIKNISLIMSVSFLKALIFFLYFSYFFDGTFTLSDDWHYMVQAETYLYKGYNFFELIQHPFELVFVFSNNHFLYQLINVFAFHLFGNYYFSPVALNIIMTFITSYFLYNILILLDIKKKYAIYFGLFYLLYWDTLNWSSILNLKDSFIQLLSIVLIYNILKIENKIKLVNLLAIVITVILFETIRFYTPFLILFAYILYKLFFMILKYDFKTKIFLSISFFIILIFLLPILQIYFSSEILRLMKDFVNPLFGVFRFILTPIPFNMEMKYGYLFFSSILNWISIPFLIYGVYKSIKILNFKYILFILFYLFVILLFYGMYGELQGPRHRLQIVPYLSFFQFLGFLAIFYKKKINNIIIKTKEHI